MSRLVEDCRARSRATASLAQGYKASGETLLAQTAERVAAALTMAADGMEDLARLEAGTADRQALAEQTVDRFLANNPGWALHLMTGGAL